MAEVTVTEADQGATRALRVGDTIVVHLAENPTTGFRWSVVGGGSASVELIRDDFAGAGAAPGSGGMRTFVFAARRAGETRLEFAYVRSWESVPPKTTFALNVQVTE